MKIITRNQRIRDFTDEVASKTPTPGGGAVAAIAGAMAGSLVEMVCNLTIGKEKYRNSEKILSDILKKTTKYRIELLRLADDDAKAFDEVMLAYKNKSKPAIKKALHVAIEVPLRTALLSKEIQHFALTCARRGNKNAHSDSKTALYLAKAAYAAAMENVRINRKSLSSL